MDRREFLALVARAAPAAAILPAGAGTYAIAIEPDWIEVRHVGVPVAGLPPELRGLRVAQLSDIHRSAIVSGDFVREAVRRTVALKPDLVALTGDFITDDVDAFAQLGDELAPLAAAAPCLAVTGNHDYVHLYHWALPRCPQGGDLLAGALGGSGIEVLRNDARTVPVRGGAGAIEVVGLDDLWAVRIDAARAFGALPPASLGIPRLVLAHNPDTFAQVRRQPFDLMLSGHTHGGQVRLPLLGAPLIPVEDTRFVAGLVPADGRLVYVNRGLGFNRRIRFGVRPEITLLELIPA